MMSNCGSHCHTLEWKSRMDDSAIQNSDMLVVKAAQARSATAVVRSSGSTLQDFTPTCVHLRICIQNLPS